MLPTVKSWVSAFLTIIILFSSLPMLSLTEGFGFGRKVCLFFDDGWKNQFDEALPVLKELEFKASFGVIADYIGLGRGTFWSRMNTAELKELQGCGMDIACHTKTHPHMLNLTHEQLRDEIIASKNALTQLGFDVKTFVCPYGELNSTVVDHVKEAGYLCARTLKPETYSLENSDQNAKYRIGSWPITNQSLDDFKQILSHSAENDVVVLAYHFISDEGPVETSTPVQNFYEQMKYLKKNNFEVMLLPKLFATNEKPPWKPLSLMVLVIGGLAVSLDYYLRKRKSETTSMWDNLGFPSHEVTRSGKGIKTSILGSSILITLHLHLVLMYFRKRK